MADSENNNEEHRGILFNISARVGVLVAVGVLALALWRGGELDQAFMRALVAVLALAALGWLAEHLVYAAFWQRSRPAAAASADEPPAEAPPDGQQP